MYRVLQATVAALARGDFREVGTHMTASHDSLRDDYQVSAEPYRIPIRALPIPYHTPVLHAPISHPLFHLCVAQVSCEELDVLVAAALGVPGVYGSRMTGGGFGGCTVTLVERGSVDKLVAHLRQTYVARCGQQCECYIAEPSEGSGVLDLPAALRRKQRKQVTDWLAYPAAVAAAAVGAIVLLRLVAARRK